METGIPLPYLDDEIKELEDKQIIVKHGTHYKANVIVITEACADEIERAAAKYHAALAEKMEAFISSQLETYKKVGFVGNDFSDNTLRWQLSVILFRMICGANCYPKTERLKTGWGELAHLWCVEKLNQKHIFSYCCVDGKHGDNLYFFDYRDGGKGDHRDFYGNQRYINILCDICRGEQALFSEYDLEAVAEMIRKGYVVKRDDGYDATFPIYTAKQYDSILYMVNDFIQSELKEIIIEMDNATSKILSTHTPKHLQNQVQGIASMDRFVHAVCIPATYLIEKKFLNPSWHPLEMPTTYVVLK